MCSYDILGRSVRGGYARENSGGCEDPCFLRSQGDGTTETPLPSSAAGWTYSVAWYKGWCIRWWRLGQHTLEKGLGLSAFVCLLLGSVKTWLLVSGSQSSELCGYVLEIAREWMSFSWAALLFPPFSWSFPLSFMVRFLVRTWISVLQWKWGVPCFFFKKKRSASRFISVRNWIEISSSS